MSSRAVILAAAVLTLAPVSFAGNEEVKCPEEVVAAPAAEPDRLSRIFETASDVVVTADGTMVLAPQVRTVMLVRRADDGSLETACVTSTGQAEMFLRPPAETAGGKRSKER